MSAPEDSSAGVAHPRAVRSFVTRAGRMTTGQARALADLGPRYVLPYDPGIPDLIAHCADRERASGQNHSKTVLEIGFGMGQATWQIALSRPEFNYLGVEVHGPGVGRLLIEIGKNGVRNLRIIQHDAVEVLRDMIRPASLAGFHIFYPDPWPKKRHHKRRLMRQPLVDLMVSRLEPGGYIYFVTDIEEYALSTLSLLESVPDLRNPFDGFATGLDWRPETKFEARAKSEDRNAWEIFFRKRG